MQSNINQIQLNFFTFFFFNGIQLHLVIDLQPFDLTQLNLIDLIANQCSINYFWTKRM